MAIDLTNIFCKQFKLTATLDASPRSPLAFKFFKILVPYVCCDKFTSPFFGFGHFLTVIFMLSFVRLRAATFAGVRASVGTHLALTIFYSYAFARTDFWACLEIYFSKPNLPHTHCEAQTILWFVISSNGCIVS